MVHKINSSGLYITGLAHAYPEHSFGPDEFQDYVARLYPEYRTSPGLQKLMKLNRVTQIKSRQANLDISSDTKGDATPPSIDQLSQIFQRDGVQLAASACSKAMTEANLHPGEVTHVVAVTCTDQSNPGYDLLVCKTLKLHPGVQRTLLHGVGCAGGLSALRAAANIAAAESQRGRPARVLVMACELCSLFLKAELHAASCDEKLHIAPALFSDAAAALVVCNQSALMRDQKPIYELQECGSMLVPNTTQYMSYDITAKGMIASITKEVPKTAVSAIQPMFDQLRKQICATHNKQDPPRTPTAPSDFDWAVHPGGAAILQGAQQAMGLAEDHIRASLEIYRSYGNSSSPTVLIVLDQLRRMGQGRDNVIATSFGPGMMIEMCMLKRCRHVDVTPRLKTQVKKEDMWQALQFKLARLMKWHIALDDPRRAKREHGLVVL
ncbi:hypothetical protein HBI56_205790 [Parastagonospora nodorum]|uniref:Uncharacterized protein n=2 Tax=Phaeosphaeria nodorum (strain SN15 / ATCC MYA-4574 / FGSC 10173) TaxID=321614 RepID=A0A7U2FK72_PHANO|nr:hypothetical protein HBH56_115800 [Parastagonospora nodorum]QRD05065.1 hypothetical protein JI435_109890 [Parastagonospora nodorum SN15]KAH3929028.1 hypothetical protein HBH54_133350 [Parastagonospora nodorum]KAH3950492.1 hypothetical protein HBH53_073650 [Parastagonospora nodorum]KAH3965776.1 hypothetical protein HBH51_148110 [Parastagonospora nodorum]